jgi:integrase
MGSVFTRFKSQRWYIRYKDANGVWRQDATDLYGSEHAGKAHQVLALVEQKIAAGAEVSSGPVTVEAWAGKWEEQRKTLDIADWKNDCSRYRMHAAPVIGHLLIHEVRPRHIVEIVVRMRAKQKAPRTVRNVYSVLRAMFRDAQLADLIERSPCILTRYQLGELEDARQGWRPTAIYTRTELEQLISDERIEEDCCIEYGLKGIGGLRQGEGAGLRWMHVELAIEPLGRMIVAASYDRRTKTKRTRVVPIHPTLAAMLAEWKLHGWPAMMGRQPRPEDLVIPTRHGKRIKLGSMRNKDYSCRKLKSNLALLGLRHRRGHDLRRTMISLAREDGARKDLLELCTHTPKRDAAIDVYTEFPWPALCGEVAKLNVRRRPAGESRS